MKPPYGTIAAIDLTKGELAWEIPNGETPENVKNHPALAGVTLGRTGRAGQPPGALATKTLLIVAEPGYGPTPDGKPGSMLRAYDKRTGRELAALQLPAPQSGSPMTYMLNGRQFLVIAVSGNDYPGELIAYVLPQAQPLPRVNNTPSFYRWDVGLTAVPRARLTIGTRCLRVAATHEPTRH